MSSMKSKILVALVAMFVLVAMFEPAHAQYGRGGYGRGYGGMGGRGGYGRGYGGMGGYGGYGRGYGGMGGYGGYGRGYGGYGRGGYGRDYDSYGSSTDGGYYDDTSTDTDDFSSYMDVYATSSSTPVVGSQGTTSTSSFQPSTSNAESDFSGYQDQLGTSQLGREPAAATTTSGSGWTNSDQASAGGGQGIWPSSQLGSSFFDLKSILGRQSSGQLDQNSKARERSTLEQSSTLSHRQLSTSSNGALATKPGTVATPVVPSSTTTSAPEYVMINPTRTSPENNDQDD